ncbi:hypothetical protein NLO83_17680 [Pseudomonas tremae]|uniref:hypothetical protein n=1 Tax=Pseudomonas syringae group TaxID=136849 RepID=UPI0001AF5423|nr:MULTISPECIES: hypothetical protein [Pseudomonas syringae group]MCQ3017414.1 hypothetical protein [Pseudomonas tremae]QGL59382.1 hypothetical protein POR16_25150 [Pseudomonas coronafaciens pv. oryzae str. 1_6]
MLLLVRKTGWGEVTAEEIQNLLTDVTKQLLQHVQVEQDVKINIEPGKDDYPEVRYRNVSSDPYLVLLSARNRKWSQYSYQFAHELCHILSNYERLRLPQNKWFHECLCELASIFVLRQMAVTWQASPPYWNWASYSAALASYAADILAQPATTLPSGQSFQDWLGLNEPRLRADPYQRTLNRLVAVRLLPSFEQTPGIWRTIPFLPNSTANLQLYLEEWASACPESDRIYVQEVKAALFDLGAI